MLDRKTCWRDPSSGTLTVLPLRSRIARTRSVPNSSKQPTWDPGQDDDRVPRVQPDQERPTKFRSDIDLAGGHGLRPPARRVWTILDIGEPFAWQELFSHVLRGDADPWVLEPSGTVFVSGGAPRPPAWGARQEAPRSPRASTPQEPPPADPSSVLSTHGNLLSIFGAVRPRTRQVVDSSSYRTNRRST